MTIARLTVSEVAERWRCSNRAVHDAIRAGRLPAMKVAGHWLIEPDAVDAYEVSRMNVAPVQKRTRRPRPAAIRRRSA